MSDTARMRAEALGPLVSTAQDKVGGQVGGLAWERVPWDATHSPRGGTIVELWRTEDGESGVTTFDVRGRKGALDPVTARLRLSECASVEPASPFRAYKAARQIMAVIGQRPTTASGPPLTDYEQRLVGWVWSLLTAASPRTAAE